jgi:hypothetical protein
MDLLLSLLLRPGLTSHLTSFLRPCNQNKLVYIDLIVILPQKEYSCDQLQSAPGPDRIRLCHMRNNITIYGRRGGGQLGVIKENSEWMSDFSGLTCPCKKLLTNLKHHMISSIIYHTITKPPKKGIGLAKCEFWDPEVDPKKKYNPLCLSQMQMGVFISILPPLPHLNTSITDKGVFFSFTLPMPPPSLPQTQVKGFCFL